jgi:hypothetical protein
MEPMEQDREIVFTIEVHPETVELDARIGPDADAGEAFELYTRLFGAVQASLK